MNGYAERVLTSRGVVEAVGGQIADAGTVEDAIADDLQRFGITVERFSLEEAT